MEQRLIDANALEKILELRIEQLKGDYGSLAGAVSGALRLVREKCPTIDPVKHGRWKHWIENLYRCSICGYYTEYVYCNNFCPNCGAKMDDDGGTP